VLGYSTRQGWEELIQKMKKINSSCTHFDIDHFKKADMALCRIHPLKASKVDEEGSNILAMISFGFGGA
jgi:hypothetical protein